MSFDELPDELLLRIFSFVESGLTLLDAVPLVCRRWHRLARHPEAWDSVNIKEEELYRMTEEDMARVVLYAPFFHHLTRYCFPEGGPVASALRRSRCVARQFHYCSPCLSRGFRDDRRAVLDLLYRSRRHLRVLTFCVTRVDAPDVTDSGGRSALEVLAAQRAVREMDVYDFTLFPYDGELAAGLPRLRVLSFHWVVPDGFVADLIRGSAESLRELSIKEMDSVPDTVVDSLASCGHLVDLRATLCCLSRISECGLPSLRRLSLYFRADGACDRDAAKYAGLVGCALQQCVWLSGSLQQLRVYAEGRTGNLALFQEKSERFVNQFRRQRPLVGTVEVA